ncbi:MAG TPA: histidine phosphatase family protein [Bacteroidales bacterium]|nr:histidine phosphatase family protein [Bacteroidales bacterium]
MIDKNLTTFVIKLNIRKMKELIVVRHAKSSWEHVGLSDHERPLLEKGKKRTKKIISFLQDQKTKPDFILTSSALRARETAYYMAMGLGVDKGLVKVDPALYQADADQLLGQFDDLSDTFNTVMLVGHNPALTNFVNFFLVPPIDWLPTSGVVALQFDTEHWDEIRTAQRSVRFVIFPKLI